ncbi:MAG: hypothetical protein H7Z37_09500 [Pyrinomonadaceae bacterium]|nr:hypothetical protein [Pyrinomonadaceae bacterium]
MSRATELATMACNLSEEGAERKFWNQFSNEIQQIGAKEFLLVCMQNHESRYIIPLMLSVPELWRDFTVDEWLSIMKNVGNRPPHAMIKSQIGSVGVHADIMFLCKYLEIDGLDLYLSHAEATDENKFATVRYMKGFLDEFVKGDLDYEDLSDSDENVFDGFTLGDLNQIKQRLSQDERVKEFPRTEDAARQHVEHIYSNFKATQTKSTV